MVVYGLLRGIIRELNSFQNHYIGLCTYSKISTSLSRLEHLLNTKHKWTKIYVMISVYSDKKEYHNIVKKTKLWHYHIWLRAILVV